MVRSWALPLVSPHAMFQYGGGTGGGTGQSQRVFSGTFEVVSGTVVLPGQNLGSVQLRHGKDPV